MIRQTSIDAYESIPDLGRRERIVLQAIETYSDRTDSELAYLMGFGDNRNKISPRRNELMKQNLITDSGSRVCTRSNRLALTWHITKKGRKALK